MGRLLILIGIIAMIGGGFGLSGSFLQPIGDIISSVNPEAIEAQAAALCNDGETLKIEQGAETYSPSSGWGRPSYFYCVDNQNNRREVTEEFGSDLINNTTSSALSIISGTLTWICVSSLGFILLLVGIIMTVRKRSKTVQISPYASGSLSPSPIQGNPAMQWNMPTCKKSRSEPSELTDRLQKLEEARSANLISQEEYDRLRQNILDKL